MAVAAAAAVVAVARARARAEPPVTAAVVAATPKLHQAALPLPLPLAVTTVITVITVEAEVTTVLMASKSRLLHAQHRDTERCGVRSDRSRVNLYKLSLQGYMLEVGESCTNQSFKSTQRKSGSAAAPHYTNPQMHVSAPVAIVRQQQCQSLQRCKMPGLLVQALLCRC